MSNKEQLRNNNDKYSSLIETLKRKAIAGGDSDKKPQDKSVEYVKNGEYLVRPDDGYVLENVNVKVNVPIPNGYLKPGGTINITENGTYDVKSYENANINVAGSEECNGLPLEVEELPEVGIEGAFYKVVKTEEINNLYLFEAPKYVIPLTEDLGNGVHYTLIMADDFPNNPVITDFSNGEMIYAYYIKNTNDLYLYGDINEDGSNIWITFQDLFNLKSELNWPFLGIVDNPEEIIKNGESGTFIISKTNTTTTLYLFENGKYMQVGDASLLPSGTIEITENGEIDIAKYEKANVNVDTSKPEQSKNIVPTKTTQTILPDTGYVLSEVIVESIPEEYIVPSGTKTIAENGTHDAREYESVDVNVPIPEGYIKPSGTLNITENGTYDVTEKASAVVSILEKQIILQNKTIDTNGTYSADEGYDGLGQVTVEVAGGTNTESEEVAGLLGNTMTILDNSLATSLRTRVCQYASALVTVNLPNVTSIGTLAFYGCTSLVTVNLPKATSITSQSFYNCTKLKHADFGMAGSIAAQAFNGCAVLTELILRKTSAICTLSNANGVNNTAIGKGKGYIYVPSALMDSYKTATNWSTFANQFRAIEDYPDICGG